MTHSSAEPARSTASANPDEVVLAEWTVHLLRRAPERGRVILLAMALSSLWGIWLFRSPAFALLGPLLLLSATAEYLLPIRYRISNRSVRASYGVTRLEIEWDRVRRTLQQPAGDAVKLSPLCAPSRLDGFRGVVLRFGEPGGAGSRDRVMALIEQYGAIKPTAAEASV